MSPRFYTSTAAASACLLHQCTAMQMQPSSPSQPQVHAWACTHGPTHKHGSPCPCLFRQASLAFWPEYIVCPVVRASLALRLKERWVQSLLDRRAANATNDMMANRQVDQLLLPLSSAVSWLIVLVRSSDTCSSQRAEA